MATEMQLQRPGDPAPRSAYRGFSWTTLFFLFWPALFRSDVVGFLLGVGVWLLSITTLDAPYWWLPWPLWALVYNRIHLETLLRRGWRPVPEGLGSMPTA